MPDLIDLGYKPPSLLTWAGLTEGIQIAVHRITSRLSPILLDAALVAGLWMMVTFSVGWILWEEIHYVLVPGWLYLVCVVEFVAVWQSFGSSFGQKRSRKRLVGRSLEPPSIRQRIVHFLMWHVSVLSIIGLAWRVPLHEKLSGLTTIEVVRGREKPARWYRTLSGVLICTLVVVTLYISLSVTVMDGTWQSFLTRSGSAWNIVLKLFQPDSSVWLNAISLLFETIYMAIMATLCAVLISAPLSFFAARNLSRSPIGRLIYTLIRGILSIMRAVQPIIWGIVFLVWVGAEHAPFAGFLALFLHSIADLTKLYAERLESIDDGPIEAITATGGSWLSVLRYAVIPQIINPYVSFTLYRWDINIRMATILGLIGAGGIGGPLLRHLDSKVYMKAAPYIYLIALLVWGIDAMSSRLRRYFDEGRTITKKDIVDKPSVLMVKARNDLP